ncbi:MAG: hypothetical protein AAFV74_12075, partial [Pseudomonadota bacterium]
MASVYQKQNGTWICQWIAGRDLAGKKIRDSRVFQTEDEAIAHKVIVEQTGGGTGKESLGSRWNTWIEEQLALGNISEKTACGYRQKCRAWSLVSTVLGQQRLTM